MAANTRSLHAPMRPVLRSVGARRRRAHIIGVVVSETTSEIRIATDSVIANSRNRRPMIPPIIRIGMNTAISDRLIDSTVKPTSRAPCSAARNGLMPFSMWRDVFSRTTIASSTTKPVAIVSAISVKLLIEKPARYMTPKVPTSDTGHGDARESASRARRAGTRRPPGSRARPRSRAHARPRAAMRGWLRVRSIAGVSVIVPGIDARSDGSSAVTRSTVSMMFALG